MHPNMVMKFSNDADFGIKTSAVAALWNLAEKIF